MSAKPVEWVLAVFYGPEAHRATYGRKVRSGRYTKDFIQLSRKPDFIAVVEEMFGMNGSGTNRVPLTYEWPGGTAAGDFVVRSGDRPHLKWDTRAGAPPVWRMTQRPTDATAETIPGDPTFEDFLSAEHQRDAIPSRGAGQPYLMAIKLRGEHRRLHLRVYLDSPHPSFSWASLDLTPPLVQAMARRTSRGNALAWASLQSGGTYPNAKVREALTHLESSDAPAELTESFTEEIGRTLVEYLRDPGYGVFFDPTKNHDAWHVAASVPSGVLASITQILTVLEARFPDSLPGDAAAEEIEVSTEEVETFYTRMKHQDYSVPDARTTIKTRGSAQKAFARAVKPNYNFRCAVTGISSPEFLVASHIVPWSKDENIRLDPANGICLSAQIDKAFEHGFILIEDDLTIRVNWDRIGSDRVLREQLAPFDGTKIEPPAVGAPNPEYLRRRRTMVGKA